MSDEAKQKLIEMIKRVDVNKIARDLVEVQLMPSELFKNLMSAAVPEEELIREGYEPVSNMGLMWIKKDKI